MHQKPFHEAVRQSKMIIQNILELDCVSLLHVNIGNDVLEILDFKCYKLFAEGAETEFRFLMKSNKNTMYTIYFIIK